MHGNPNNFFRPRHSIIIMVHPFWYTHSYRSMVDIVYTLHYSSVVEISPVIYVASCMPEHKHTMHIPDFLLHVGKGLCLSAK